MGKPGPKRKEGARYPSGDLKPARKQPDAVLPPAPAPRQVVNVRDLALSKALDPRLGSSVGLLWMSGKITRQEYRVALAYARLRGQHDRVMGIPGRMTLSPDYGVARAMSLPRKPPTDAEIEAVREEHRAMRIWVEESAPQSWCAFDGRGNARSVSLEVEAYAAESRARRVLSLLDRVCVDDLSCEWAELPTLRTALQRLATWFDIPRDR